MGLAESDARFPYIMSRSISFRLCMKLMPEVAAHLGMPAPSDLENIDTYLPYLERMRAEGCYVVLKIDGPRPGRSPYTSVVSGAPLGDETFHIDASSLVMAAAYVIVHYARACWGLRDE
jgi:hypothetical protein